MGSPNVADVVRCAVVGDQSLAAECAEIAIEHGLDIVVMATNHPVVASFADLHGIPHVDSAAGLAAALQPYDFDILFSIANLRILPAAVLDQAQVRINFHDGPLPGYAGLNVTSWSILGGEDTHGIAWHLMTPDVDAGEIVATENFALRPDETAFGLNARCYEAALASFPRIAAALAEGSLVTTPQPAGTPRLFRKHERPCSVFDPADPAVVTDRAVRAHAIGDRVRNTLGAVRLVLGGQVYVVNDVQIATPTDGAIGSIVAVDDASVRVRVADADVVITAISHADGTTASPSEVVASHGFGVGSVIASPDATVVAALRELDPQLSRHEEIWLDRLGATEIPSLPAIPGNGPAEWASHDVAVPAGAGTDQVVAALAVWTARTTGAPEAVFAYTDQTAREIVGRLGALVQLPIGRVDTAALVDVASLTAAVGDELAWLAKHATFLSDAVGRDPRTHGRRFDAPVMIAIDEFDAAALPGDATTLCFAVADGGGRLTLHHRLDRVDATAADRIARQVATLLRAGVDDPTGALSSLEMLSEAELAELDTLNDTGLDHDRAATIDHQFRAQVDRTPDAPAVSSGDRTLSYTELAAAVDELAGRLRAAGVGARDRVGIAVHRGIDMVVSVLATLECGAAYVPLDPTYPEDRLRFMVSDSGLVALLAQGEIASLLSHGDVTVVDPADRSDQPTSGAPAPESHGPADLAYVIYTSGSTGTPKGVMLEHHNVVNFFAAMDEVIEHEQPGVWLAVTSLSFDISVLELLWTLTRGFHVVLKSESGVRGDASGSAARAATARRPVSMSMFYFAAGEDRAHDGYRLLLESARFADRNGFEAVWTPERHFHAFGGSYPNPSVVGAAVAAVTERIHVRAGSVVLPLHSPIRVAEEWAIVDNLTNGRTGISFAAGWQPNDFVLNPSAYANAREGLPAMIDTVARLWRGEAVTLPGHDGEPVEVRTLPRPVQAELPIWLTSAGSTSTFERAGTLGTNVLTHLLGQSVEQLSTNIAAYRRAWTEAGHAGEGRVTLMLHTFLDRDAAVATETAREPMKSYLGTAVGLLKDMASAFPTFANSGKGADEAFKSLTPDEMSQLLDMAAARYLETSGLFGTPDDAVELIERVSAIGVDEVACLIDFGVDTDAVLDSLDLIREAKDAVDAARSVNVGAGEQGPDDRPATSMAELVERHCVTHLQCTPSLAAMLLADPSDRAGLASIRHMMVGGEALPTALAGELRRILPDRFTNMYGPTETTIWSLVHEIAGVSEGSIPIGLPIGNNTVFVLDDDGRRVPIGVFGELHIGGEGVARGYHGRDELTSSRFVERPGLGRVYATGDVVRIHPDRFVEFAGRADNQVKIRGHRIELGEIETVLDAHPDVVQSVVVARGDVTDPRLVAFVIVNGGTTTDPDALRKHVADTLPDVMVPAAVVVLDTFPLTPNGKIDRKALPDGPSAVALAEPSAPPTGDTEQLVARIWTEELARPVGRDDNFFEIGGHSLLAVKVFRRLADESEVALALTDIFRYPTVRSFAAHLAAAMDGSADSGTRDTVAAPTGTDRGAMRRRARSRHNQDGE